MEGKKIIKILVHISRLEKQKTLTVTVNNAGYPSIHYLTNNSGVFEADCNILILSNIVVVYISQCYLGCNTSRPCICRAGRHIDSGNIGHNNIYDTIKDDRLYSAKCASSSIAYSVGGNLANVTIFLDDIDQ